MNKNDVVCAPPVKMMWYVHHWLKWCGMCTTT